MHRPDEPSPGILRRLARRRVSLGFVCGAAVLWLARPTGATLLEGLVFVAAGEGLRIWAAGHLEKGREVTCSGPYRWLRHPLYVGSAIMGIGLAVAAASTVAALLIGLYLVVAVGAAIATEDMWLKATFGGSYDAYRAGRAASGRHFSLKRAFVTNREYRTFAGLAAGAALMALKALAR